MLCCVDESPLPNVDPLSDVFTRLRVHSTLYFRTALRGEWGIEVPRQPNVTRFHIVVDGPCVIATPGASSTRLQRGDLALVPHGARHFLRSRERVRTVALSDVLDASAYDGRTDLTYGRGDGPVTTLVCGHFEIDDEIGHPALRSLPPVVHVSAASGHDFTWLDAATRTIGAETATRPPGWEIVVDRVSEILLVQALRVQLDGDARLGAAAFADPRLARALAAIHADPAHAWDLAALARRAGMSRTAFAVHFRECMGLSPIAYVTRWRLQRARAELVHTDRIVARIAHDFGYASEAAFSRAFQRLYGQPPATYRRTHAT